MKIPGVTNSDKNTHEEKVLGRKMDCAKKNQRDRSDIRVGGNAGQLLTFTYIA
jgi:hypothetical protein